MRKAAGIIGILMTLAACAPAAGRPAIQMLGTTQTMVSAAAAACPGIAPDNYNFLSVESIGDNFVSCHAEVTTGVAFLNLFDDSPSPDQKLTVSFSAVSDQVVQVAISSFPRNEKIEDQLYLALKQSGVETHEKSY